MSKVVSCRCGTNLRVPEERLGQLLRCPKCGVEFLATEDARVSAAAPARENALCPTCQSTVEPGELTISCPACAQIHHRECWAEIGGCSTYGCTQAPAISKPEESARPLSAWGDTKKCPACGERIKSIALRCRYCGTEFGTVDPLTVDDLSERFEKADKLQGLGKNCVVLFVLSLLGCLAPVLLVVNVVWFLPRRRLIAKAGPVYVVLGYASLAVTSLFTVLLTIFVIWSLFSMD